jgi:hypothetical protein
VAAVDWRDHKVGDKLNLKSLINGFIDRYEFNNQSFNHKVGDKLNLKSLIKGFIDRYEFNNQSFNHKVGDKLNLKKVLLTDTLQQ